MKCLWKLDLFKNKIQEVFFIIYLVIGWERSNSNKCHDFSFQTLASVNLKIMLKCPFSLEGCYLFKWFFQFIVSFAWNTRVGKCSHYFTSWIFKIANCFRFSIFYWSSKLLIKMILTWTLIEIFKNLNVNSMSIIFLLIIKKTIYWIFCIQKHGKQKQ